MNLLILLADEFLVESHLHFLLMQQNLLLLQQRLLFLQGSTENLFGIANHLLLALPLIHRDITARLANLRQHHRGNPILEHQSRWQLGPQHQGIESALVNEDHLR